MPHKKQTKQLKIPKIAIDISAGIIATVVGGLLLVGVQQWVQNAHPRPTPVVTTDADIKKVADIHLDTSIDYVKQQLGVPQKLYNEEPPYSDMLYDFNSFALKISTKDGSTINSLSYYLKDKSKHIEIIPDANTPHLTLGVAKFGDYANNSGCGSLRGDVDEGLIRYYCDAYFGRAGNYWHYRLGVHGEPDYTLKPSDSLPNLGDKAAQTVTYVSIARTTDDLVFFYKSDF